MYKRVEGGVITIVGETYTKIPEDESNRDWQHFLEWEKAGGVPQAADPAKVDEAPEVVGVEVESVEKRLTDLEAMIWPLGKYGRVK